MNSVARTPLKIFIGSSTEQKENAERIAKIIEDCGHIAELWWSDTVFPAGATIIDSLRRVSERVDAAVFLFAEDDQTWIHEKEVKKPRDNVLIEYGLFLGALGGEQVHRVVFCRVGKAETASDVGGVIYIPFLDQPATFKQKFKAWLDILKPAEKAKESYVSLHTKKNKESLFIAGERIVNAAKRQVTLSARTPVPIVGTRPYDERDDPEVYELTQLKAYDSLIEKIKRGEDFRFTVIASLDALRDEIKMINSDIFSARVKDKIKYIYSESNNSNGKIQIRWCIGNGHSTFVTADDETIVWFKRDNQENVWINSNDQSLAAALRQNTLKFAKQIEINSVLLELGLEVD